MRLLNRLILIALLTAGAAVVPGAGAEDKPAGAAPYSPVIAGHGSVVLPDGSVYEGEFERGLFNGQGVLTSVEGDRYSGAFHDGLFEGAGEYRTTDGRTYRGEFHAGTLRGKGEILFSAGGRYVGEIDAWRMNGSGRLERADGSVYTGGFRDNHFQGQGEMSYASGDRYVGGFDDGRFQGEGVFYFHEPRGGKKSVAGQWKAGHYVGAKAPAEKAAAQPAAPLDAEAVLFHQYPILARSLRRLEPQRPGVTDLYFVSFGAYGGQDVFMKEARYTRDLFERNYGTRGRALMLVNNRATLAAAPLASVSNLRETLDYLGRRMDVNEDILFLYLTSHGSQDAGLSVALDGVPLDGLPAEVLADLIKRSGIKWKVIVISACYSGAFIDRLKDDQTLIMTSARSDRTSFGCSDDADFTYFGRALFERALPGTASFGEAFVQARALVDRWEDEQGFDHSEPQLYTTPAIEAKLAQWRAGLPAGVQTQAARVSDH